MAYRTEQKKKSIHFVLRVHLQNSYKLIYMEIPKEGTLMNKPLFRDFQMRVMSSPRISFSQCAITILFLNI